MSRPLTVNGTPIEFSLLAAAFREGYEAAVPSDDVRTGRIPATYSDDHIEFSVECAISSCRILGASWASVRASCLASGLEIGNTVAGNPFGVEEIIYGARFRAFSNGDRWALGISIGWTAVMCQAVPISSGDRILQLTDLVFKLKGKITDLKELLSEFAYCPSGVDDYFLKDEAFFMLSDPDD